MEVVGGAGDLGADVIATTTDRRRVVLQYKQYGEEHRAGSPDLQRLGGTCYAVHEADVAIIVTTSSFTEPALEYAASCGMVCVEGTEPATWTASTAPAPWAARVGEPVPGTRDGMILCLCPQGRALPRGSVHVVGFWRTKPPPSPAAAWPASPASPAASPPPTRVVPDLGWHQHRHRPQRLDHAHVLREEIRVSGVAIATAILKLAVCFHQAVLSDNQGMTETIARLRDLTDSGDYAYYTDIAAFMADRPGLRRAEPRTTPAPHSGSCRCLRQAVKHSPEHCVRPQKM
ncbi:restriction endonuclease [Streptomyces sp. NPDC021012]|uniref:restriction endonuclease n=1 Tax=Streptomyces sp. NPDC021012 TaxID=3365107 RepID=UPI0037883C0E